MAKDQNIPRRPGQNRPPKRSARRVARSAGAWGKFDRALEDLTFLIIQESVRGRFDLLVRLFAMYKNAQTQENRRKVEKAFRVVSFELRYGEENEENDKTPEKEDA